jgi:predicted RNase H-like HicB family nuclease
VIRDYIAEAMRRAKYEMIDDSEPFYGHIPGCRGVWATGTTLEECRQNLEDALDGWLVVRIAQGLAIPPLGKARIRPPARAKAH